MEREVVWVKDWHCNGCNAPIQVPNDYEPEYCCDGRECGCYGLPVNPMFCDACEERVFGSRWFR